MPDPRTDLDAKLNAEIEAALGGRSIEDLLDEPDQPTSTAGTGSAGKPMKKGIVVSVHGGDVMVEFGPKSQGICPVDQFDEPPKPGEELEFMVLRKDRQEGLLILSRRGQVSAKTPWEELEVGQTIDAICTGTNKGGLEMEVANHRAFMPAGHVDLRHVEDLDVFINEKMTCEIIELDKRANRMILSRKAHMEMNRAEKREELLKTLEVGQEVPGIVTSLQNFGAFVDIGGVDGLVHISDLSYKHIKDPAEVVKIGEQITVKVMKIDDSEDPPRIGLGLKQTMSDPFQDSSNKLEEGGTVTGRVTKITDFGAFVEIAPGVEGLIHISELSHDRVNRVDSVVKPDEIVTVRVLNIDKERQRIGLSLKAMKTEAEAMQPRETDGAMERLKAKFGGDLKGGLG